MNSNVPAGAAILLDFIYRTETDTPPPGCYEVVYGHHKMKKPLTSMTLDEVEADGPRRTKAYGSSAAGAAQFMRDTLDAPKTLKDIEGEMGLTGKEKMTPDLQDLMAYHLLKRRGYLKFVAGQMSMKTFGLGLAKEWASFPVLEATQGAKRKLTRGQSYYAGDGRNKALVKAMDVEVVLAEVLNEASRASPAKPAPSTGPAAFPVKGARKDEVVAQVQRRLKELGYSEIGNVDGDFGDLTEKAIIIFKIDNQLPPSGSIDSGLLVAMAKAKPRAISAKRAEASPAEVRDKVPEARDTWVSKVVAFWGTITAGAVSVVNFAISNLDEARKAVRPLTDILGTIPLWAWGLLFGGGLLTIWLKSRGSEAKSQAAYQSGERR